MKRNGPVALARGRAREDSAALDVVGRGAERALRLLADPRIALALLVLAAAANLAAAADSRLRGALDSPAYLALVGAILLTGIAGVAVRAPSAWREWRHPSVIAGRRDVSMLDIRLANPLPAADRALVAAALTRQRYRMREATTGRRWVLLGTKRGWSRFAALGSHLALVVMVVGAAVGTAFAEETRIGLFPGEQSLLAPPGPGLTSAVRLERLDAEFDPRGDPVRFDTHVAFIRDGELVRRQVLRVNEPGWFDGHLVHAWTYGPAVELRVEDLAGRALFDGTVALEGEPSGGRAPFVELPSLATTLGVQLADAAANEVLVVAANERGVVLDSALLRPGEERRLGDAMVSLSGFTAYVTFLSRTDPGMPLLFAGAGLLTASLGVAFYLPRRRVQIEEVAGALRIRLRGERFDSTETELERLTDGVMKALEPSAATAVR